MTDITELVKQLRRLDYKTDLDEAAADALERQAKWLEGFVKHSDEMAIALSSEATKSDHLFAENSKLRARIAELEAALKPFATLPTHGEYGGPLVQARVYYECEPNDRCGIVHINKTAFRAARAALKGEKR